MTQYLDCYIRVSTTGQKTDGNSLTVQKSIGQKISKKLKMKFRLRDEGSMTSTRKDRPVLMELEQDIEDGIVKNIWIQDHSRMFRDQLEGLLFRKNFLKKYGVNLYIGDDGKLQDFSDPHSVLVDGLLTQLQEYDNQIRSEKSQRGKIYKLEKLSPKKSVYMGGTILFGYTVEDKEWRIEPSEEKWVQYIFDQYENGVSSKQIKDDLDRQGVQPRRTRNSLWNLGTLVKMLRNKSYTGIHEVHIKKLDKTYSYKVPKIINVGQFNRVQKLLDKNMTTNTNHRKHFSLLGDVMVCECGTMIGSEVKNLTNKKGFKVNTRKYQCVSKQKTWRDGVDRKCKNTRSMNMDITNDRVLELVKNTVKNSSILKEGFKSDVLSKKFKSDEDLKQRGILLERKIQRLQTDIDRIENNIVECEVDIGLGKRDRSLLDKIISRYHEELDLKKSEYTISEKDLDDLDKEKSWLDWVGQYGEKLEFDFSDEKKQKDFLNGVLDKITVRSSFGKNRDGQRTQVGHSFDIRFKLKIVNDGITWNDPKNKSKGYEVNEGRNLLKSPILTDLNPRGRKSKVKKKELKVGTT
jgi:hypothetical protein